MIQTSEGKSGPEGKMRGVTSSTVTDGSPKATAVIAKFLKMIKNSVASTDCVKLQCAMRIASNS